MVPSPALASVLQETRSLLGMDIKMLILQFPFNKKLTLGLGYGPLSSHTECLFKSFLLAKVYVWRNGTGLCMALIPGLWRQRQVDLCEFETSLVYK